jgi:hypothetical protein
LHLTYLELFNLARRKNVNAKDAMDNGRWMKGLQRINTSDQIDQFAALWDLIQSVKLTDYEDVIT